MKALPAAYLAVVDGPDAALLCRHGVAHGQGYLYSRPVPAEQFRALVGTPLE